MPFQIIVAFFKEHAENEYDILLNTFQKSVFLTMGSIQYSQVGLSDHAAHDFLDLKKTVKV